MEISEKLEEIKKEAQKISDFIAKYGSPYITIIIQQGRLTIVQEETYSELEVRG